VVGGVPLPDLTDACRRVETRVADSAGEEDDEREQRQPGQRTRNAGADFAAESARPLDPLVSDEQKEPVQEQQQCECRPRREADEPQCALRPVHPCLEPLERRELRVVVVQPHQQDGERRERRTDHEEPEEKLGRFPEEGVREAARLVRADPPYVDVVQDDEPRQGQDSNRDDHANWSIRYAHGVRKPTERGQRGARVSAKRVGGLRDILPGSAPQHCCPLLYG
jgi:hypothetical protein